MSNFTKLQAFEYFIHTTRRQPRCLANVIISWTFLSKSHDIPPGLVTQFLQLMLQFRVPYLVLEALQYLRDQDEADCFAAAMHHVQVNVDEAMITKLRSIAESLKSDLLFTLMFYTGTQSDTTVTDVSLTAQLALSQRLDHTKLSESGITKRHVTSDQIAMIMALAFTGDVSRLNQLIHSFVFDDSIVLDSIRDRLSAGNVEDARIVSQTIVGSQSFTKQIYQLTPAQITWWVSVWNTLNTSLDYHLLEILVGHCIKLTQTREAFHILFKRYPQDEPPSSQRLSSVFEQSVFKMKSKRMFPQSASTYVRVASGKYFYLDGYSPHILDSLQLLPPSSTIPALYRMYKRLYFKFATQSSLSHDGGLVPFHLVWPIIYTFSLSGLQKSYEMAMEECYIFLRRPASYTLMFFNLSSTTSIQVTALVRHYLHQLQHTLHHGNQPSPLEIAPSASSANKYKRNVDIHTQELAPVSFYVSSLLIYRDRWGAEWTEPLMYNIIYEHVKYHNLETVMNLLRLCRSIGITPTSRLLRHSANFIIRTHDNAKAAFDLISDNIAYLRQRDCSKMIVRLGFQNSLLATRLYRCYLLSYRHSGKTPFLRHSLMQIISWSNIPPGTKLKYLVWINGMQVGIKGIHADKVYIGCALRIFASEYRGFNVPAKLVRIFLRKARRVLGQSQGMKRLETVFGRYGISTINRLYDRRNTRKRRHRY